MKGACRRRGRSEKRSSGEWPGGESDLATHSDCASLLLCLPALDLTNAGARLVPLRGKLEKALQMGQASTCQQS